MLRHFAPALVLVAAAWLPLTAHADDDMPTYKLTTKAGKFYPETIEVKAGVKFRIAVTNEGPGPEEFDSKDLKKETVLAPGVTRSMVFAPLKPGVYKFMGEFHMDTANGQIIAK